MDYEEVKDIILFYNIGFAAGLNFAIEKSFDNLSTQFHTECMLKEDHSVEVSETIDKIGTLLEEQHRHFDTVLEWLANNKKNKGLS